MELPYGNIRNDSSAHETHDIAHTANGHHEDKGAACGKPPPLHCPWQEGRPACTTACTTANGRRRKPLLNEALHGMHAAIGH